MITTRKNIIGGFLGIVAFAFVLYGLLRYIGSFKQSLVFSYDTLQSEAGSNFFYQVMWFLGDMTEAQFYKGFLAAIGLILFGFIAHLLDKRKSRYAGFNISYGSGLWPWVLTSASLGLLITLLLYGHLLGDGWFPTFVAFVSIPPAIVLMYGGGWKNTVTGSVLGGVIAFPIAWFVIDILLAPIGMPSVIGNVTGMWLGGIISFEICKYLPWMKLPSNEAPEPNEEEKEIQPEKKGNIWFVRRVLADFTEAQFYGNEWASIGMLAGVIILFILDPIHPAYGSGLLPAILLSQFLTLAIGNLLYFDQWEKHGWYPTFVPVVSVAPAVVLIFGGTFASILLGAALGALIGPPLAHMIIRSAPKHWHPVVGNTFSMTLTTLIVMIILNNFSFM